MLTTSQIAALKAAIIADPNLATAYANKDVRAIDTYLSGDSTFVVWKSTTPTAEIFDAITWANLTPNDSPDGTQVWANRNLQCQSKQLNLQIMLQGQSQLATGKANVRGGLSDALSNVPSGAGGALVNAGWLPGVKTAIYRFASLYEKIFATGTGTSGTPGNLVVEGSPVLSEVADALYNPDGTPK